LDEHLKAVGNGRNRIDHVVTDAARDERRKLEIAECRRLGHGLLLSFRPSGGDDVAHTRISVTWGSRLAQMCGIGGRGRNNVTDEHFSLSAPRQTTTPMTAEPGVR